MSTQRSIRTYLKRGILVFAFLLIACYALFETRHLLLGPVISIEYPENGSTVADAFLELRANTKNVAQVSLNDRPVYINSKGHLKESLLLSHGYNIIYIKAEDRFGRSTEQKLEILVQPVPETASSSPRRKASST